MLLIRQFRFMAILMLSCFLNERIDAQQFGGNPPSLKWNQINTDTARIVFPAGLERQAEDVAGIVHALAAKTQCSIGSKVRKVDIVLQNQTTVSNGYVALGPYRSEFFLTPTQNSFELGSLPWHKTLALHEYRHVQQNNNFRKGLTRVFYDVFGEEGQALASNLAIPDWFWEGDAVFQETLLSDQGRGRLPFFFNDYRSIWAAGKRYSWMKLRNGSYLDFTPDHYRLGYMLVAYGREKYGDSVWAKITDRASRFRGLFYPFQSAVEATTGEPFAQFRQDAMNFFRSKQPEPLKDTPSTRAAQYKHFDKDEEYPQLTADNNIVYVGSSYKAIPSFRIRNIKTGEDRPIAVRAISNDHYFSYKNGRIVYAAYETDARWTWKNFGVIKMIDVRTGNQHTVTKRTKYFSPDISEDGKTIAAVQMDAAGNNAIHFINAFSGKLLSVMPNERSFVFTFPKFFDSGKIVSAVRNRLGEMALGIFDIRTGDAKWLTPFSMNTIAFPQVNKDTISFTMSEGSQEKLFASINGVVYRFLPSRNNQSTGSYQLCVRDGWSVYTDFTAVGYHMHMVKASFEKADVIVPHSTDTVYRIDSLHAGLNLIRNAPTHEYPVSKYPQSFRLVNVHSWRPYINDPEYTYSVVSENILNTLQSELYVTYNRNEQYKETGASLAYAGWFPVISGGASYRFGRSAGNSTGQVVTWNEFNANAGPSVPLNFVHGSFTQNINVSTTFNTQQVFYTGASKNLYRDQKFNYGDFFLSAVNQQTTARQQIYPRFAQALSVRYRSILNNYTADQLLMTGSIYLPGLFTNHSLVIQGAFQRRDTMQQYVFTNSFPISRGYSNINFPVMWKAGANYHFPIVYPDWGFGNIFFLQRIRGNLYYDYSQTKSLRTKAVTTYKTMGAEVYFDSSWWNQLPVSFGIRYSRLLDTDPAGRSPNQWELVLPLNLLAK